MMLGSEKKHEKKPNPFVVFENFGLPLANFPRGNYKFG